MAQLKVFVSHSSTDKAACDTFVATLRRAGADVWYDEHNLGAGQLLDEIQRELHARSIFIVLLSKGAFASTWVRRETTWAFNLYNRESSRLILPVTIGPIEASDFNTWLFLEDFKRVEAPGFTPYPLAEATERTQRLLELTPAGQRPAPAAPPQASESLDDMQAKGKALMAQKKYAESILFFERATQRAPRSFDAWANLAFLYGEVGRWQDGLTACDRALALDDKRASEWGNKGRALNNLRRYDEALAAHDRALAINPNLSGAWSNKGIALESLTRYDEALVAYVRALALYPKDALAWNGKGSALRGLNRHADAVAAYDQAIALDPKYAVAWSNKAISLRALGRTAEAEEADARAKALGG